MSDFWRGRQVLCTGSEGLIGRPLCRMLYERGAIPIRYDKEVGLDILTFHDFLRYMQNYPPSIVIHLAALSNVGQCRPIPHETFRVLALGTVNVLEACRLHPVDALVTASSNHVYGQQVASKMPTGEDAQLNHLDAYSVSKICADYMARSYGKVYGLPVSIIRNTNCFGPDDPHDDHIVPSTISALLRGDSIQLRSDGKTRKGYLYVDDVAEAYLDVAQWTTENRSCGEAFNVTGETLPTLELVERIAQVMGVKAKIKMGTADPLDYDEQLDDSKIRVVVGWRPRHSLDDALRLTVEGFKARKGVPA